MRGVDRLLIALLTVMAGVWISVMFNLGGTTQTLSAIFHWIESLR
ncbi:MULTISPECIES: hypothetical protein [unclassified Serratia (in: enterobacteria)]|nr:MULTISPECIES: hypothetical protein [unclassified Serratia (in: enterobacteria)]